MRVDILKCTGCALCLKHCPMHAISIVQHKAQVDQGRCAECGVCVRVGVCRNGALEAPAELPWPRSIRSIFSNPLTEFKETGVTGRGTEEMKTNDVTDRFREGMLGIAVDVGRPNVGTTLRDVEVITTAVAPLGVAFEDKNPVTFLMADKATGKLKQEVVDEAVVSAVVEFVISPGQLQSVIRALQAAADKVDTVFSVGVISRVSGGASLPVLAAISEAAAALGHPLAVRPDSKVNIGIGRKGL